MRQLLFLFAISAMVLFAQDAPARGGGRGRGPQTPPKNLKVLPADANLIPTMRAAAAGLGVMCTFCHVEDRSSDEKPEKLTARMMFQMVNEINGKFPDGKVHVTCYTCHRGAQMPLTAPPAAQ
jgi:Photosynthetic reaction centre cytochrome C subunit